ncbi:MAG: hypothetical protein HXY50_04240, partial [Ignavibacteriaceae bacterium]|nr:hypothetical protein [Ignavibacteriaceae bacterium]
MKIIVLLLTFLFYKILFATGGTILGINVSYIRNGINEDDFISKTDPFTSIYIDPGSPLSIDVWRDGGIASPYKYSVFNQQTSHYQEDSGGGANHIFDILNGHQIGRWSAGVDNDFMDFRVYQQLSPMTPLNGSNQSGTTINFGWISSSDVSSHWLQVDDNSDFSSPFFDHDVGNYVLVPVPGFPNDATTFYWRVQGKYAGQWGPYTATWSFTNGQFATGGTILGVNVTYLKNGIQEKDFISKTDPFTSFYIDPGSPLSIDVWRDGGTSSLYLYSVFNQQTSYYDQFSGDGTNHEFDIPSGQEIGRWSVGVDNDFMDFRVYQNSISGLVAYYPFNGNANDESGNG